MIDEIRRLATRRTTGPLLAAAIALGIVYVIAVANLTIWPTGGTGPRNAIPFHTIWGYVTTDYPLRIRVRNLAGNLVMLAPLGLLLGAITTWRPAKAALAITATSTLIEVWQLLIATGRSVDIDDIILNTTGGLLGFGIGLALIRTLESIAPSALDPSTTARTEPVTHAP